ncbi:MAG TPA: glycosyltransferase family 4 protein [Allosphingosinicella sp.]|jgi:glycosyltransferase involved in cell wall biosynthesis
MTIQIDSWTTGLRGDIVQRPLVEALAADGRVAQRLVFSSESQRKQDLIDLGLPYATTPNDRRIRNALSTLLEIRRARARLHQWYRQAQPRIVHIVMGSPWDHLFVDIPRRHGSQILLTVHDSQRHIGEESWAMDQLEGRLMRVADHIAVLSSYAGEVLRARLGDARPIHVVVPGLVMDSTPPGPPKPPPSGRPMRFLFFGRIHAYKGLDLLLDAWRTVKRDTGLPIRLTVAGSGDISPYRSRLEECPDVELVHGWISDERMAQLFDEHDVNVLPYREGSLSATALAGMWAGMPAIATPIGGFAEQIKGGVNAVVSRDVSADALVPCIVALATDPELYRRLAQGAHDHALTLSAPAVADNWVRLYRRIGEGGPPPR